MHLESLRIRHFRNITSASLEFQPGVHLITGGNGQGKSNLLEAIGLLASGRSFRRAPPMIMRQFGQPLFALHACTQFQGLSHQLDFIGQDKRQLARLDGKALAASSALGQILAAVIFTPQTMRLTSDGPAGRRAFLDWIVFTRNQDHVVLSRDYLLALKTRHQLLRRGQIDLRELNAWEDQLARLGVKISQRRHAVLEPLQRCLAPFLELLSLEEAKIQVILSSAHKQTEQTWLNQEESIKLQMELLHKNREVDRRSGTTSCGPHREDLLFILKDHPLARIGSQGQQKRFILALKMAEAALLEEKLGEPPLLLLDDPIAELDMPGIETLTKLLELSKNQVFLATCDAQRVPWGKNVGHILVEQGQFHVKN
ncbi:MAG: DNA replication and repair protein RecF [Magnetococcus sp. DMHC-6]